MALHSLNPAEMDTDPAGYMRELVPVIIEVVGELNTALDDGDQRLLRAACLRLTSIGALAGMVGRKLDAE